jgi:hypothetical protein
MKEQSLLGKVFDSYQNMMQITRCLREAARQKSVDQFRVLELSRMSTELQEYLPEAEIVRFPTHEGHVPALSQPVALPFADKSFDGCFVTDAYEHIPQEQRPSLLSEMLRVTDGVILLGCPQGNEIVPRLDKVVFDFIWGKYAERFEPLEQHQEFGLEPVGKIMETLKSQGADEVILLPDNYVYRWIHMILIYFDVMHRNPHWELFEPFNRIYNERLSAFDYQEPCYRYLMVIANHPAISVSALNQAVRASFAAPESIAETDALLVQTFREVDSRNADQLRWYSEEFAKLHQVHSQLAAREQQAQQEIHNLKARVAEYERGLLSRISRKIRRLSGGGN